MSDVHFVLLRKSDVLVSSCLLLLSLLYWPQMCSGFLGGEGAG